MQLRSPKYFNKSNLLAIACGWLACLSIAGSASAQQYPGVKCIVDGQLQCNVRHWVEFGHGKVFFGNQAGVEHFQTNVIEKIERGQQPAQSLVLKANHQLAVTNQVQQELCPVTGKPIKTKHHLIIAGVKVFFHDDAAKEKMQAAESTWHRAQLVFASDAFAKNFTVRARPPQQAAIAVADESSKLSTSDSSEADSAKTR